MSGHSKWHKIQHKKGKADAARSNMFTKAARVITVAAREGGGDPEMNFSLRLAIEKAKAVNMPKANIERAIQKGTGEGTDGEQLYEVLYEGFGPAGVAVLVDVVTDNTNRTVSEIKHTFSKYGGSMGSPGSVRWQFEKKGIVRLSNEKKSALEDWDSVELALMDAGVDEIDMQDEGVQIECAPESLKSILDALKEFSVEPDDSGLEWVEKETVKLSEEDAKKVTKMMEAFDELDDVRDVYTNTEL